MDPDPGDEHYFQIFTDSFNKIRIFFLLFLYATTLKPKPEIRTFLFFSSSDRVLRAKDFFISFWLIFCHWIRIQEAKMLRIQRIRNLSTGLK